MQCKKKLLVSVLSSIGIGTAGSFAGVAFAQQPQKVDKIEVTGSSIKRIEGETALPVTVITREQIEKAGITSATDFMDRMTANNGQGYNAALAIGDSARPGFSGASLRGLGSNNTLVLLNGRRMAIYAFDGGGVNLNAIPFSAIERVEILRDGASAVYGTDAIGGVINFITRKDFTGIEVSASKAEPRGSGGGAIDSYSATFGFGDLAKNRFNVMATFQANDQERLRAADRSFANTVRRPDLFTVFSFSSNSFPAAVNIPGVGLASPAGPIYSAATGLSCLPPASYGQNAQDNRCRYDYVSQIDIIPTIERKSFLGRGTFQINANTSAFAEYSWAKNEYVFRSSQSPISEATTLNGDPVLLPASSRYYPTAWLTQYFPAVVGQPLNLYYRSIEGGPRTNGVEEEQDRISVGVEGTVGNWDYSVGYAKATNKADESYLSGYFSEARTIAAFGTGNINPFAPNDATGLSALLGAQVLGLVRKAEAERQSFDLKASTELMQMKNGPMLLAVGGELSKFKYNDQPQAVLRSGDIIGGGGDQQPVNASRDVDAVFAELSLPVFKSLEAQVALRHDRYSDFGKTTNPKVSLRWQPNTSFLMRAAAGKGFRAPTLPDLFAPQTQTNTGGTYDDPLYDTSQAGTPSRCAVQFDGRYCNAQLTVKQGGNPALEPEKSSQWTMGVLFEPTRDLSISLDYWVIRQRDLIAQLDPDVKLTDYIANFNNGTRTSTSIYAGDIITQTDATTGATVIDYVNTVFQNVGVQVTKGVDISVKAKLGTTPVGTFRFSFDGTYIDEQSSKLVGQDDFVNTVGSFAQFGPVVQFKHTTAFQWDWKAWSTSLTYNWVKGYIDENGPGVQNENHRVGNYETWDISTTYSGIKNLRATVGLRNIFDRDPPQSNANAYFHVGFDPTSSDPRGRTLFGNVSYSFK